MANASFTLLIVDRAARERATSAYASPLGHCADKGFSAESLRILHAKLAAKGTPSRLYELAPNATLLAPPTPTF